MFKKIELWVVILLCIFFVISTMLYGALLRHHYIKGDRFPTLQKAAIFFAGIPSNFKNHVLGYNDINAPMILTKHKNKPRFKRFINLNREELLILPRYDGNLSRSVVEIIDLNTFEVLHTYKHDINSMHNLVDVTNKEHEKVKIDDAEIRFEYRHPSILEDGSLISHSELAPLFKIDFCSNLLWINQEEKFHHSIMLDYEGNIWVGSEIFPYSNYISKYNKEYGFHDDTIAKINDEGQILFIKSVSELLYENNTISENEIFANLLYAKDPIHLNDIEPAFKDTEYWKKGDLFMSIRHQAAIIHYRPSTNELINYIKGPFYEQHDVDIISNKEISIFNNNNSILKNSKYSEVLIYNFETNTFSQKFYSELNQNNFKTETEGLAEILNDGSMLVEEQNHGRLIFFNTQGEKEWEFVNKDNKGNIYFVSWSRIIDDKNLISKIKAKIKNTQCQN